MGKKVLLRILEKEKDTNKEIVNWTERFKG